MEPRVPGVIQREYADESHKEHGNATEKFPVVSLCLALFASEAGNVNEYIGENHQNPVDSMRFRPCGEREKKEAQRDCVGAQSGSGQPLGRAICVGDVADSGGKGAE